MFEAWFIFVLASFLGCGFGAWLWGLINRVDNKRFEQRDWVAEQRRRIDLRGHKTRMGARN